MLTRECPAYLKFGMIVTSSYLGGASGLKSENSLCFLINYVKIFSPMISKVKS